MPQLRGTEEPFEPQMTERLQTRRADLESLVRGMYVRGLSTKDVSALFAGTFGGSRWRAHSRRGTWFGCEAFADVCFRSESDIRGIAASTVWITRLSPSRV